MYNAKSDKNARFELTVICACTQLSTNLIIFVMNQRAGVESFGTDTGTRLTEPYVGATELKHKRLVLSVDQVPFSVYNIPLADIYTFSLNFS